MKIVEKDVKSQSNTVGVAKYEVFDNIEEASEFLGPATILDLVNAQHRTNALNKVRSDVTGKPSKAALRMRAMASIPPEEFQLVAGDVAAMENLVSKYVAKLESEAAASAPAAVEVDVDTTDDDDDED